MRKRKEISGPLPLPVGFTLLPSLLPGRQLTPFLHIELNGLPIYLVISPTHEPHLSFLSVILALKPKGLPKPLALLLNYDLGKTINLTLDGVAPWADIWVPLPIARRIISDIGAERLFWSEDGRGLLGDVDDAVSWEEDGGWSHNWLPSKSHLPVSSYSLDNLLTSKWPLVEIIPKQRCMHTPASAQRLARLSSEGLFGDPSRLRSGPWVPVWDGFIEWTCRSWHQYQASPSRLSPAPTADLKSRDPMIAAIQSIPSLFGSDAHSRLPPLDPTDIHRLLSPSIEIEVLSFSVLATQVVRIVWELCLRLIPGSDELRDMTSGLGSTNLEHKKVMARVNVGFCSLAWDIVIGIWRLSRENENLRRILKEGGGSLPADIVLPAHGHGRGHGHGTMSSISSNTSRRRQRKPSSPSESEGDALERLERKRGGSPARRSRPKKAHSVPIPLRKSDSDTPEPGVKASSSAKPRRRGGKAKADGPDHEHEHRIRGDRPARIIESAGQQSTIFGHSRTDDTNVPRSIQAQPQARPQAQSQMSHTVEDYTPTSRRPRSSPSPRRDTRTEASQDAEVGQSGRGGTKTHDETHRLQADQESRDNRGSEWFTSAVMNPVLFGVLATIVYVWWKRDPPEPSVVVL